MHLVAGPVRAVLGGVPGFAGVAVLAVAVAHRFFSWAWPRSREEVSVGAVFDGAAVGAVGSGAGADALAVVEASAAGPPGAGVVGVGVLGTAAAGVALLVAECCAAARPP